MKAKIYVGAKKYALYIGRKIVQKTLEFLTLPARFVSKKVQELKNLTMWGQSVQDGTPTPTTPIEIESVGDRTKNLCNSIWKHNTAITTAGAIVTSNGWSITEYIPIKDNIQYTWSRDITNDWYYFIFSKDKQLISYTHLTPSNQTATFRTPANAWYIVLQQNTNSDTIKNQLEESSTATPYEPYGYKVPVVIDNVTTNIYLNEPLRKIGNYADTLSVDGTDVTVVRNVGSLLLNTVSFNYSSALKTFYSANAVVNKVANLPNVYCETYKWSDMISATWTSSDKAIGVNVTSAGTTRTGNFALKTLAIKDTDFTTQAEFKNAIGEAKVYYALATPTTETYTIESPIQLPQGTLTIDIDTKIKPSKINITGDIDNE